jgi:hypothetical protein
MAATEFQSLRDWRQGSVLPNAVALDVLQMPTQDTKPSCVVLISHDCDIVNDEHELEVEVIVGQFVDAVDGNLTGGKNSRRLHLDWSHDDGTRHVELRANGKRKIPKSTLASLPPDLNYRLDAKDLVTLRFWLGARYNRAAFPDEFNNRLRRTKVGDDIVKILKPLGNLVSGVYVHLDTQDKLLVTDATPPYRARLFIAFEPGDDPLENADKADAAANAIADAIGTRCYDKISDTWKWLELKDCIAVSEDDLTVGQAKKLQQLPLEYLSLRATPQGVTPLGTPAR